LPENSFMRKAQLVPEARCDVKTTERTGRALSLHLDALAVNQSAYYRMGRKRETFVRTFVSILREDRLELGYKSTFIPGCARKFRHSKILYWERREGFTSSGFSFANSLWKAVFLNLK
jgi:hypothetical protein